MKVLSGIPQGSVLGPLLFVLYISDLPDVLEGGAEIYLFADDSKLFKFIQSKDDHSVQQMNLNRLQNGQINGY